VKGLKDPVVLLESVREAAKDLPRDQVPALVAELARLSAEILMAGTVSVTVSPDGEDDRLLTPAEVAERLNRSAHYVYAHRHSLPTTRLLSGRWAVKASALDRWIQNRSKR
jgi:hypothetical protein